MFNNNNSTPRAVVALLACAMVCMPIQSDAAQIHWRSETFNYVAQDKSLKEFIREFAAAEGLTVVVAPEVEGTINGKFNLTPGSLLELLTASFGVSWYYDGSVLHVYPASDVSTEVIRLEAIGVGQLRETLSRLDITDSRYPIAYDSKNSTARVSGPKRYVELVKQTARASIAAAAVPPRRTSVCFHCDMRGRRIFCSPKAASSSACLASRVSCGSCTRQVSREPHLW